MNDTEIASLMLSCAAGLIEEIWVHPSKLVGVDHLYGVPIHHSELLDEDALMAFPHE